MGPNGCRIITTSKLDHKKIKVGWDIKCNKTALCNKNLKGGWGTKRNELAIPILKNSTDKNKLPNSIENNQQAYNALEELLDLTSNNKSDILNQNDNNNEDIVCNNLKN